MNKEKIIEAMANAICDESHETHRNEYTCLIQDRGQSMMDVGRLLAQAALKALCKELPNHRDPSNCYYFYHELRSWGEDE